MLVPGDTRGSPLLDSSLFAGAQEFDRHKRHRAEESTLSLSKVSVLLLVEGHVDCVMQGSLDVSV